MFNTGSLSTCIYITILVLALVIVMPEADTRICRKLGLNVMGGLNTNPRSGLYLKIRTVIILLVFLLYFAGFSYIVFFSRSAAEDYLIHIALFQSLANSVRIDFGVFGLFWYLLTGNFAELGKHFEIVQFSGISQVYLNVMLFIPMGYLLPYMSRWFRRNIRLRPLLACFLMSLAVENIQLISRHGYYDLDDLVTNTLGGILGTLLFVAFAFRATYPNWKTEIRKYRKWRKNARKRTLYPFAREVDLSRTILFGTDESAIYDFYVMKLGFRVVRQLVPENDPGTSFLLELGTSQVEIRCSNKAEKLPRQYLAITADSMDKVRKRMESHGIKVSPSFADPYTGKESFSFEAPDNTLVTIIDE